MDANARPPRSERARSDDQHFLRSAVVAAELVRDASIGRGDHVLEIGGGAGRLSTPLADAVGRLTIVELDPALVAVLRRRFAPRPHVTVLEADIRRVRLPRAPWRAFGNIPFSLTTPILRRLLDDPVRGPDRADLLVQLEAGRKRAAVHPSTLLSAGWLPWWDIALTRRLPRLAFDPPPNVDAGLLVVRRREAPLLPVAERDRYAAMLRRAFDRGGRPVRRSLPHVPPMTWKRLARERGLPIDAPPSQLDVWDWVALYRATDARR